jgi:hypothetical protein
LALLARLLRPASDWISSGAETSAEAAAGIDRWTNGGDERSA